MLQIMAIKESNRALRRNLGVTSIFLLAPTMVPVAIDFIVGDHQVVRVVVRVETVLDIVTHNIVRPNSSFVAVGVDTVVHAVDLEIVTALGSNNACKERKYLPIVGSTIYE